MRPASSVRAVSLALVLAAMAAGDVFALPLTSREGVLPVGSDLNEDALDQPTELFNFEIAGGKRSYKFNLGDMAFSSPAIFNPKTDDHVFDPVRVPSLRGAKYTAPYTHNGRFATLRDFVHNAVVNEFAGPEPSEQILDALVHYVEEIAFLPNAKLASTGQLTRAAPEAARRGEAVFNRPFPHNPELSCAACHQPSNHFVDNKLHDVQSGKTVKTPTLVNANFNAPYFHDGRYDSYEQVVDHFDRAYALALSKPDRADLIAYLKAVGDADAPFTRATVAAELQELADFASVLDTAIPKRDRAIVELTVESVGHEWREIGENFPDDRNPAVSGGLAQRLKARLAVRQMVLSLRQIAMAAASDDYARAAALFAAYKRDSKATALILQKAEPYSLFNPALREKHLAALRQLNALAVAR